MAPSVFHVFFWRRTGMSLSSLSGVVKNLHVHLYKHRLEGLRCVGARDVIKGPESMQRPRLLFLQRRQSPSVRETLTRGKAGDGGARAKTHPDGRRTTWEEQHDTGNTTPTVYRNVTLSVGVNRPVYYRRSLSCGSTRSVRHSWVPRPPTSEFPTLATTTSRNSLGQGLTAWCCYRPCSTVITADLDGFACRRRLPGP